MNFTQMHERLRLEMQRRVQRGSLSVSLLSRQTGFGQSHMSNFLHSRGVLSLEAMDRVLAAQGMAAEDLLRSGTRERQPVEPDDPDTVPVVSHNTALYEPVVRAAAIQMRVHLPPGMLQAVRSKAVDSRKSWQRFVAIRIDRADVLAMDPLLHPNSIAVIDRHYNSMVAYRPTKPNLYAVRDGAHLTLRYADYVLERLVLRPLNIAFPLEAIEIRPEQSPGEYIAGRVAILLSEI
jgi:hypothetical protein